MLFFSHNFLDVNIAVYTKACICNNVIMQIQVQANKVALEVAHLQELLNHWGNAPCTVARIPLDASADTSTPHGRFQQCHSSGHQLHTPHSQDSRHHSPNGGASGWRHRSASPPCGGSGWSPAPPPGARQDNSGKWPRLALAISPSRPEVKDAKATTNPPVAADVDDGWSVPSPPPNPTND